MIHFNYYESNRFSVDSVGEQDLIVSLVRDNWDDFGYKTYFGLYLTMRGQTHHVGAIRLLIGNEPKTSIVLDSFSLDQFGGKRLDLEGLVYLSLGTEIEYYSNLVTMINDQSKTREILSFLHDVVYLENDKPRINDLHLRRDEGFRKSLLRDHPALEAYGRAKEILFPEKFTPNRFNFALTMLLDGFSEPHTLRFNFAKASLVPTNVNVLIGKNGVGKSQALYRVVDYLLGERTGDVTALRNADFNPLDPFPPFEHILAVSFSPFSNFPLKAQTADERREMVESGYAVSTDSPRYSYCGLRGFTGVQSPELAWSQVFNSLTQILSHDNEQIELALPRSRPKLTTLFRALFEGLEFEEILVPVPEKLNLPGFAGSVSRTVDGQNYLPLGQAIQVDRTSTLQIIQMAETTKKFIFETGGEQRRLVRYLSAGQEMFVFMAFSLISEIKNDSVVLVDEPELYFHPNLEISYVSMLKSVISMFESYAIVSTHSVFVTREIPSQCVQVISRSNDTVPRISAPAIETYGANISEIANIVFDNIDKVKPYEEQLKEVSRNETDFESFRRKFGDELSLQALTFVRNQMLTNSERRQIEET